MLIVIVKVWLISMFHSGILAVRQSHEHLRLVVFLNIYIACTSNNCCHFFFILWIFKVARRAKIGNLQKSRKNSYPVEAIQNHKAIKTI